MAGIKRKYNVYKRYITSQEEGEGWFEHSDWKWMGSSFAVSERQALNNVQFRIHGDGGKNHGRYKSYGDNYHVRFDPEWVCFLQYSDEDKRMYNIIKGNNK